MIPKTGTAVVTTLFAAAWALAACGHRTKGASGDGTTTTVEAGNPAEPGDSVDPAAASAAPAQPAASDVAGNAQTQGEVAAAGLDAAASAAAAGTAGAAATAGLTDASRPQETVTAGALTQSCYASAHLQSSRLGGLAWPESTDAGSIFADSKNDPNDTTEATMFVEPALIEYPVTGTPAATLSLPTKMTFTGMVEVVEKDTRQTTIQLADAARTQVAGQSSDEQHRFWVAKSGPLSCVGTVADADGKWAKIKWGDAGAVDGLILLERFSRTGTVSETFFPKRHGQFSETPVTVQRNVGLTGARLVQFKSPKAGTVTKTITHTLTSVRQTVDAKGAVTSDVGGLDEVRATSPLVITDTRDDTGKPLTHVIASGAVLHTGKSFFTKFDFANVTFDRVHAAEPCIPVSGTVTMTTYDKEGGQQLKQVVIKFDPTLSVAGDDANGTQAQWMLLHVDRRCDLRG